MGSSQPAGQKEHLRISGSRAPLREGVDTGTVTLASLLVESGGGGKGRGLVVPSSRGSKGRFCCIRAERESRGAGAPSAHSALAPAPTQSRVTSDSLFDQPRARHFPRSVGAEGWRGKVLHVDQHPPCPPSLHPGPHGAGGGCRIPEGSLESPGVAAEKTSGGRTGRRSLGLS